MMFALTVLAIAGPVQARGPTHVDFDRMVRAEDAGRRLSAFVAARRLQPRVLSKILLRGGFVRDRRYKDCTFLRFVSRVDAQGAKVARVTICDATVASTVGYVGF